MVLVTMSNDELNRLRIIQDLISRPIKMEQRRIIHIGRSTRADPRR
jgi:hypothetical protein